MLSAASPRAEPSPSATNPRLTPPAELVCSHCSLPVPEQRWQCGSALQFCCDGCQTVHGILRENGLQDYYRQREALGAAPERSRATRKTYDELDDPTYLAEHGRARGKLIQTEFLLEGVHCAACIWLVERLPLLVRGVVNARLDFARKTVRLDLDPEAPFRLSEIAQTLDSLGYPPHPASPGKRRELAQRENRQLLVRIAVAGACAANVMLLSLALYSGAEADAEHAGFLRMAAALVSAPSVLWAARVFYRGAWSALCARSPHMDIPVTLGIAMGTLWGAYNTLNGASEIYFDSVTMLIFLLLVGRYLQQREQQKAEETAGGAFALAPRFARRVNAAGEATQHPVEAIRVGDRVEVRAGERFAVDGVVEAGESHADEAWLTGESRPKRLAVGSPVLAGSTNLDDRVIVEVLRAGSETRLAQLCQEVERAGSRRAPIAVFADRLAGWFTLVVLGLAVVAILVWWPSGPSQAVNTAVALLIVTCPCALGLATPLAVSAALAQASQRGFLIKGGALLEALARPAAIAFDKTGTLTHGTLRVISCHGDSELLPVVRALEERSAHPVARALQDATRTVEPAIVSDVVQRLGHGIEGVWEGKRVYVGRLSAEPSTLVEGSSSCASNALPDWARSALREQGEGLVTPVGVYVDDDLRALLLLADTIRDEAAPVLLRLRRMGYQPSVLSGDRQSVAEAVAARLGSAARTPLFDAVLGGQSPEDKLHWVERHIAEPALGSGPEPHAPQQRRPAGVFMVGDGVNDAAALSAATVGIAVHGSAEAGIDAAHVVCTRPGVAPLEDLIIGARRAVSVIRTNLALSLGYNTLAAALTLTGHISPLLAAVLMPLSSLTVILHSYQRRTFPEPSQGPEPSHSLAARPSPPPTRREAVV